MEAMKEKWTDERLDDLNRRVDNGFTEIPRSGQRRRARNAGRRLRRDDRHHPRPIL